MKDIFHDLYNRVLSFFTSQDTESDPTKGVAMNRLKTVLMQDRAGFSERAIQMMREELVSVVSKYMEIDEDNFQLQIDALENKTVLDLSIPVIRPKTDEEIDETIKEAELKNKQKAEEITKELEKLIKEKAKDLIEGEIDSELIDEAKKNVEEKEEKDKEEASEEQEDPEENKAPEENKEADDTPENEDGTSEKEPQKASKGKHSKKK